MLDALAIPGANPDYHLYQLTRLRKEWPTLYWAVVALSGYDHELYNSLGWRKVEFPVRSSASGKGRRVECVWVNDK